MNKQNWTPTKVKDVAKIVSGATPKTSIEENWGGDIPWLTPKDLSDNPAPYTSHGSRFLTEQGFNSCSTHMLPKGTVLLTSRAPVGYVSVAANDICTNQGFKSLVLEDGQIPEFWYYLLSANTETLLNYSGGSTFKELSKRSLEQIEFLIPPIEEQCEIVNFMQALDLMIQAGDREIASAEQMRGDVLNSILFGNDSEWEEVLLSDIATINPRIKPLAPDTPFIEMADVDTWGRWAIPSGEKGKRGGIRASGGDTLMARITPCLENGKIAQVPPEFGNVGGSTEFIVLRATEESLPDFIFLLTQSHKVHAESIGLMVGTSGRQRVSAKDVGNILVPFPPLEEQEKVVARMQTLDAYLESAKRSQEALKQVRQDALHALLSGDKDVRDLAEMFATDEDVA